MTAREKPAPLVWKREASGPHVATIGDHRALVWPVVGGEYPWRSVVRRSGSEANIGRVVSHFTRDGAFESAEKWLRKVAR